MPAVQTDGPRMASLATQELRFAMAFTGGVSLAIWMGGVAREVDLLIQSSDRRQTGVGPVQDRATPDEDPVRRFYRRILDLVDVQVAVDVLSGTSAGGINAALLGVANAQRSDLSTLRDTWLNVASLTKLLRNPSEADPPSLLQGDGQLLTGLHDAVASVRGGSPATKDPRVTDVFITTTYLSAEISTFADDWGTQIVDTDHHGQFHFDENSLKDRDTVAALALAARSSASFPAAFEPSFVPLDERGLPATHPDMERWSNATRSHWAADGGLLVNRPIGPLLQSIFDRGADREVRRALLYVVPTSAAATPGAPDVKGEPLPLANALVRDLEATLNQSISADLAAIREHNDRTRSASDTRLRLAGLGCQLPSEVRLADQDAWGDYRQRQGDWLVAPLVAELSRQCSIPGRRPETWGPATVISQDASLRALCKRKATAGWPLVLPDSGNALAGAAALGRPAYDHAKATLLRMLRLGYTLATTAGDRGSLSHLGTRTHAGFPEQRQTDLRDLVREHLRQSGLQGTAAKDAVAALATDYGQSQGVADLLKAAWTGLAGVQNDAAPLLRGLADQELARNRADTTVAASSISRRRASAAAELITYLDYLARGDSVRQLLDLHVVVRSVLPVLVEVEQPVQLIQVSADTRTALDTTRSTAAAKLTGLQFHHFGAFYKTSWRANDWMWGRLDGCGWLVHVLLDPRRILTVLEDDGVPLGRRVAEFEAGLTDALDLPADTALPDEARRTLAFLDDEQLPVPTSLPDLALWASAVLQRHIAADELRCVAATLQDEAEGPLTGAARAWLADFDEKSKLSDEVARRTAVAGLLASCPVAGETFEAQRGTPLYLRTVTRAAAVATAAATAVKDPPASLRPTFALARSITRIAYLVTDRVHGNRRLTALAGALLMACGALALQFDSVVVGLSGAAMLGAGGLLLALSIGDSLAGKLKYVLALALLVLLAVPWLPFLGDHLYSWLTKSLVPWLHREKWAWPVLVLLILVPPATTVLGWLTKKSKPAKTVPPAPPAQSRLAAGAPVEPYPAGIEARATVDT